jgi:hypothetical protein
MPLYGRRWESNLFVFVSPLADAGCQVFRHADDTQASRWSQLRPWPVRRIVAVSLVSPLHYIVIKSGTVRGFALARFATLTGPVGRCRPPRQSGLPRHAHSADRSERNTALVSYP